MPFFDWLEIYGYRPDSFSGSYSVTIGDCLSGTFGASHGHVFGADVKLVCDVEDMIMGRLETVLPLASALLSGVGGATTFVYGSSTSATYVGPKIDIHRAKSINKTSDNIIARKPSEDGSKDVIDWALVIPVTALSVLICAAAGALDLAIRFQYEEIQKTRSNQSLSDHDKETRCQGYEETIESLKIASYSTTGRLMALLKLLEDKGTLADFGKVWLREGAFLGLIAFNALLLAIPSCWEGWLELWTSGDMKKAFQAANSIVSGD